MEKGGGGELREMEVIHCDDSHCSLTVRDKVTRQCLQTTTFLEEKGEPKRIRTDVPLLTSLTPYRLAKPAHSAHMMMVL